MVKQNGLGLQFVPKELLDYEICLEAVKSNGHVLYYVPEGFQTNNLCFEALYNDRDALKYMTEKFKYSNFGTEISKAIKEDNMDTFKENNPNFFSDKLEKLQNNSNFGIVLKELNNEDLKNPEIVEEIVNKFSKYECSLYYDIDKIKNIPKKLLENIIEYDFEKENLIENASIKKYFGDN